MQKNNIWDICLSVKHTFVMTQYMLNGSLLNFPKGGKFSWTKEAWEVTVWEKERRKQKEEKRQVEPRAKQPGVLSPRFSNALNASTLHDLPPPANRVWAGPPWSLVPMSPLYSLLWPSEQLVMLSLLKTLCTHICDYCIALKLSAYKSVSQTVRDTRWVICEPLCLAQSRCWGNMWYEVGLDALDLEMTAFIPSWASTYRQWELCSHCYLRQTAPLYPESRPIIPVVIIPHPISLVIVSLLLFIFFSLQCYRLNPGVIMHARQAPNQVSFSPTQTFLCFVGKNIADSYLCNHPDLEKKNLLCSKSAALVTSIHIAILKWSGLSLPQFTWLLSSIPYHLSHLFSLETLTSKTQ